MRLTITIDMDNAAFAEDQDDELLHIFGRLMYQLPPHGETGEAICLDSNGNTVGKAVVEA